MATDRFKVIDPYQNYDILPQSDAEGIKGNDFLNSVKSLQVGFGSKVMRVDRQGIWLGAADFASAPFSVDMLGNMTATSATFSGYIPTGGALSDVGVGNITGTYIASGTISTAQLNANAINGMTITGALIRTSSSGGRVEIDGATDNLEVYDSGGTKRVELDNDELIFYNSSGAERGGITSGTTNITISALDGGYLILDALGSSYGTIIRSVSADVAFFSTAGLTMYNQINMNGYDIIGVDEIVFNKRTSTPNRDGEMLHYDDGSAQSMRVQMNGTDYTFDLTFL